jgi:hypothetical protein
LPVRQVINKLPIAWWTMGMREEEEQEAMMNQTKPNLSSHMNMKVLTI